MEPRRRTGAQQEPGLGEPSLAATVAAPSKQASSAPRFDQTSLRASAQRKAKAAGRAGSDAVLREPGGFLVDVTLPFFLSSFCMFTAFISHPFSFPTPCVRFETWLATRHSEGRVQCTERRGPLQSSPAVAGRAAASAFAASLESNLASTQAAQNNAQSQQNAAFLFPPLCCYAAFPRSSTSFGVPRLVYICKLPMTPTNQTIALNRHL